MKVMGAEFFSLLRSGLDVRVEFDNSEDLRRYRDSYILHILDYVMQDRERVHFNDIKRFDEYNKDKVTLDNVFELANNQNKESEDEDELTDDALQKELSALVAPVEAVFMNAKLEAASKTQ